MTAMPKKAKKTRGKPAKKPSKAALKKPRKSTITKQTGKRNNGKPPAVPRRPGSPRSALKGTRKNVDDGVQHAAPLMLAPAAAATLGRRSQLADADLSPDAPHELSLEKLRLGLAAADQQRVLNNLDRSSGTSEPMQTGSTHPPSNAKFVATHAELMEGELERGASAIAKLRDQQLVARLLWDLGLARKPRAAIVGRAIYELGAKSQEDAFKAKNNNIAGHINIAGKKHHLSVKLRNLIDNMTTKDGEDYSSALAGYLIRPLVLLQKYGYLQASRPGVYLVGDGLTTFVDFPRWEWHDEEGEQKLHRPPPTRPRS